MMKNQIIIVGITLVLIFVGLTGCFEGDSGNGDGNGGNVENIDSRFVGTWKDQKPDPTSQISNIWILKSNGSWYYRSEQRTNDLYMGTWNVTGDQFCRRTTSDSVDCKRFEISDDGKTITLYDDEDNINVYYHKQ